MSKKTLIIVATFLMAGAFLPGAAARSRKTRLITGGFILAGVDGGLVAAAEGRWFFEPDSDLADYQGQSLAGVRLQLLPSAGLEKITADVKNRSVLNYKLWGRVTKYKDRNFLFPMYSLPLSKVKQPQPLKPQPTHQQQPRPTINEPNDILMMPQEILDRLSTTTAARTETSKPAASTTTTEQLEPKADVILADRIGFLIEQPDGISVFVLDALGRGISQRSIRLLPCEVLEYAEQMQSAELEPVRFKVAGIVTRYKGQDYLLLQRAVRVYDYGNFGR